MQALKLPRRAPGGLLWFLLWLLISSAWCLSSASRLGATFDEPAYITAGLERWRTGLLGRVMEWGTMPLPVDVVSLPAYVWERTRGRTLALAFDDSGHASADPADFAAVLPWARAATLIFWWVLLWHAWLMARAAGGRTAGVLVMPLIACEPTLLAHAGLATTDVALTATLVAATHWFREARDRPRWWGRVGVASLWFGACLLSKASALLFGPLCLLAAWRPSRVGPAMRVSRAAIPDLSIVIAIGLAIAFLYCGTDRHIDEGLARALPAVFERLPFFSNAAEGFLRQFQHNAAGHGVFLLGRVAPDALWYYFPVALAIKLTVPFLAGLLILAALRVGTRGAGAPAACSYPLGAALVIIAFSVLFRVQIGVRLILPAIAFLAIGLAVAAARALDVSNRGRRRWMMAAAIAWMAVDAARTWPDGLRFTNQLWGGTAGGYRLLSDSNYDWGQGLPALQAWQERHGIEALDVWYFGTDPASRTGRWRLVDLTAATSDDPTMWVRGRYLAASTTLSYGSTFELRGGESPDVQRQRRLGQALRASLLSRQPIARTSTFLIYEFTRDTREPEAKASGLR